MKTNLLSFFTATLLLCVALFQQGCTDKCEDSYTYTRYTPIYKQYADFRKDVVTTAPRELQNTGKIYYKTPYLYINELNEGVHVFDNTDKSNPQNIGFIAIEGNMDIAIKGDVMYADNYTDLLAVNIANPQTPVLDKRLNDVFLDQYPVDPNLGVLVDYAEEQVTEKVDCTQGGGGIMLENDGIFEGDVLTNNTGGAETSNNNSSSGVGGSMARFTIPQNSNQLYIATISQLKVFNISSLSNPQQGEAINLGWNIETIYPFKDKLMIGSMTGMFIYDISNPMYPSYMSEFSHAKACDPVVAEGNYAYVTLREGTNCGAAADELIVVDISDMYNPTAVKHYPMTEPYGLGIDNNTLFVCDGSDGLKIYDATDVTTINEHQIKQYKNIQATDVIPYNDVLMMIGTDGFYQYDYSNLNDIKLLSKIEVQHN